MSRASITFAAAELLDRQEQELLRSAVVQADRIVAQTATGNGNIAHTFSLARSFRLVYVRCHFAGGSGMADLHVAVDSAFGSAFDARLASVTGVGTTRDVFFKLASTETGEPSAWTFRAGDTVRIDWTNPAPGTMTWGLEIGLAATR